MARRRSGPRKVAPAERWITFHNAPLLPEAPEEESARAAKRREKRERGEESERLAGLLADLSPRRLATLGLPEALVEAVALLARLKGNARARQERRLALLVREAGIEAVAAALDPRR